MRGDWRKAAGKLISTQLLPAGLSMIVGVGLLCFSRGLAADARSTLTAEAITQTRTFGQWSLSPNGRLVTFVLSGYYFEFPVVPRFGEENNVRVVSLADGTARTVTRGSAPKTAPRFSPASDRIAFESEGDIWIVPVSGGNACRVTSTGRSRNAAWAPDGRALVFVSTQKGRSDLWRVEAACDAGPPVAITNDEAADDDPQWSPDGTTIVYSARRPDEHYYARGIYSVRVGGGTPRRLTPGGASDNSTPRWAPDGSRIAFLSDRSGYVHVWVMDPDGGNAREFDTGPHDAFAPYWTVQPVWSRDASSILVSSNDEGRYDLYTLSVDGLRATRVAGGEGQFHEVGWSAAGELVFAHETRSRPAALFIQAADGRTRRRVAGSTDADVTPLPPSQRVEFKSDDGTTLHGFMIRPADADGQNRLPAIVALHPNCYGQFSDHWSPFYPWLASQGYVLLLLDQRGSSGYGRAYRDLAIGAWGTGTFEDVKAAAAFIRRQPDVDPKRVGVMGLSFGGYQVLLALTKTPDLFAAGVDLMGVADRRPPFATRNSIFHIGASPSESPDLYDRVSPITSLGALTAPLLIIHSDGDRNVPPEQTQRLVAELKRHRKPFDVVVYPGEAHGLADPAHQLDSYKRIKEFFDHHLRSGIPNPATRADGQR